MRLKKGKEFYKMPRSCVSVEKVQISMKGKYHILQPTTRVYRCLKGEPKYYIFSHGNLEIIPAPNKNYIAYVEIIKKETL